MYYIIIGEKNYIDKGKEEMSMSATNSLGSG